MKLPVIYKDRNGKPHLFPFEKLETFPDGLQGFTRTRVMNDSVLAKLVNGNRHLFLPAVIDSYGDPSNNGTALYYLRAFVDDKRKQRIKEFARTCRCHHCKNKEIFPED